MAYQKLSAIKPLSEAAFTEGSRCYCRTPSWERMQFVCRSQYDCRAISDFKNEHFHFKESFWMLPVLFCDISLLGQGEGGPISCMQDKRQISMLLTSVDRKEMEQSRLIETKSTPHLCELPLSWLKTLTVGNYSAGEHQPLKLMCNHELEPDIKENLTIFGSHKHPCK